MPRCGHYCGAPRRCGGGKPRANSIQESISNSLGTAYTKAVDSVVYARNMAVADAISAAWSTAKRCALHADPLRTELLGRWESILGTVSMPGNSSVSRRNTIAEKWYRLGSALTYQAVSDAAQRALGPFFFAVEHIPSFFAYVTGPVGSGFAIDPQQPWSSTVAKVLIRVQLPLGADESDFRSAIARLGVALDVDGALPAWATYDWYRPGPLGTLIPGGPSLAGFYLDDPHNVDYQIFD